MPFIALPWHGLPIEKKPGQANSRHAFKSSLPCLSRYKHTIRNEDVPIQDLPCLCYGARMWCSYWAKGKQHLAFLWHMLSCPAVSWLSSGSQTLSCLALPWVVLLCHDMATERKPNWAKLCFALYYIAFPCLGWLAKSRQSQQSLLLPPLIYLAFSYFGYL